MYKQILGLMTIMVLAGILIGNLINNGDNAEIDEDYLYDVTGDTDVQGGMIAPVESVGILPGETAPDFTLQTLEGEEIRLSDLKGKKVMLNFWYTWCPPCKDEMPVMQEFYEDHKDEMEIIAVNMTESERKLEHVESFIEEFSLTFPVPLDVDSAAMDKYRIFSAPTSYFIGTDGKVQQPVVKGKVTYELLEEKMNELK